MLTIGFVSGVRSGVNDNIAVLPIMAIRRTALAFLLILHADHTAQRQVTTCRMDDIQPPVSVLCNLRASGRASTGFSDKLRKPIFTVELL